MENEKLIVIDGSSLVHRAFYALPDLKTKEGIYTNSVYGFLSMYYNIKNEYNPDYICVAFDKKGPTFRHEQYKEYKGHRDKTPQELGEQFPIIKEILETMNVKVLEMSEFEADDIAGTLAKMGEESGLDVYLVTGDKDYLQLATDKTKVLLTRKGISEVEVYDRQTIIDKYEITPEQLIDLKGLMGDSSDNIPGVPGIGEKRGLDLIKQYGSIENVYENIEDITAKKMKENLVNNEELAYLSKMLGTIITDVNLDYSIEDFKVEDPDWIKLKEEYDKYELKRFLNEIPEEFSKKTEEIIDFEYKIASSEDVDEIIKDIKEKKKFAFKFLTSGDNLMTNTPIVLGIKVKDKPTYYIENLNHECISKFKEVFESKEIEKIGHELKEDIIILFRQGINISNYTFDSMIAKYIINPGQTDYSINQLSEEYFGYYGIDEEEIRGKGKKQKSFFDVEEEEKSNYLAFTLEAVYRLEEKMLKEIKDLDMDKLYFEIELPLVEVLASMQYYGFEIDKEELEKLSEEYDKEIKELTKTIHDMAGVEFNVNSPKQVGEALFDTMGLPVIKKTKTGYSTSVEVLEQLVDEHPIINNILRYREIAKLKSTYIDGFIKLINSDTNRIHSTFNQTITTTGRISSTEPNLQNIPIRTEDGRKIRKAFISKKPEYTLVDADYSQIELRVLAHISNDKNMIDAFNNNVDIHSQTASQVFHVPLEEVNSTLRNNAKAVNFGIVYGISDYGLSQDLNISRKEAREYIDKYLHNYQGVKDFMDNIVIKGKENGYVETLFNRRRYIPELSSKNFNIRSFGERIALNTPIQGSAADIIKIAMVKVYNELENRNLKSRLILQVHDELIIETHKDEKEEVEKLLKEIMENAIELNVPLIVDLKIGDSWYETQ
ncbi:MAG TPA: DNA polymerase I [Tissierellaceae bacterium]